MLTQEAIVHTDDCSLYGFGSRFADRIRLEVGAPVVAAFVGLAPGRTPDERYK